MTQDQKLKSGIYQHLAKGIVLRALKDLSLQDTKVAQEVDRYIHGTYISEHIELAELPEGLLDAMKEISRLSHVQRQSAVTELFQALKKTPRKTEGFK